MMIMVLLFLVLLWASLISLAFLIVSIDQNNTKGAVGSVVAFLVLVIFIIITVSAMREMSIEITTENEEIREQLLSECLGKPEMEDRIVCRVKLEN